MEEACTLLLLSKSRWRRRVPSWCRNRGVGGCRGPDLPPGVEIEAEEGGAGGASVYSPPAVEIEVEEGGGGD